MPIGGHHQLLLELPVTKQSEGASLPSATMTTVESQGSGISNIWVRAENLQFPEWAAVRMAKGHVEKARRNWNTKSGNLQAAMTG